MAPAPEETKMKYEKEKEKGEMEDKKKAVKKSEDVEKKKADNALFFKQLLQEEERKMQKETVEASAKMKIMEEIKGMEMREEAKKAEEEVEMGFDLFDRDEEPAEELSDEKPKPPPKPSLPPAKLSLKKKDKAPAAKPMPPPAELAKSKPSFLLQRRSSLVSSESASESVSFDDDEEESEWADEDLDGELDAYFNRVDLTREEETEIEAKETVSGQVQRNRQKQTVRISRGKKADFSQGNSLPPPPVHFIMLLFSVNSY